MFLPGRESLLDGPQPLGFLALFDHLLQRPQMFQPARGRDGRRVRDRIQGPGQQISDADRRAQRLGQQPDRQRERARNRGQQFAAQILARLGRCRRGGSRLRRLCRGSGGRRARTRSAISAARLRLSALAPAPGAVAQRSGPFTRGSSPTGRPGALTFPAISGAPPRAASAGARARVPGPVIGIRFARCGSARVAVHEIRRGWPQSQGLRSQRPQVDPVR